jgi:hypothetical protein
MSSARKRLLLILLALAVLLWILGLAAIPLVNSLDVKIRTDNVILNGIPFILIFIGVIVAFIDVTIFAATKWNNKISEDVHRPIERILIAGIVFGVIGMFQPFTIYWYTLGFAVLLLSTIGYIFWSHIIPRVAVERAAHRHDGLGSVSISEIEHKQVEG